MASVPDSAELRHTARPFQIGSFTPATRFTLAPLAGYTNLPFRMSIRDLGGVGLCTTDLVNARAVLQESRKTMELLATCPEDRPLGIQIFGAHPHEMAEAARKLQDYGATLIDINMGCPVRKVAKTGAGSAMMCDTTGATVDLVRRVVDAVTIPVTVKMRLGWDSTYYSAPYFASEFEKAGVAAVTIHGRTREQGFSGSVDREGIRAVVEAVQRIPVIGNGDVRTIADADRMFRETGCAAIAVGRGALANPWIFQQLSRWWATGEPGRRGSYEERLDFMVLHFKRMIDWRGTWGACLQFRKTAAWYCRALKTGKQIQQMLVMLDSPETLYETVHRLREQGPPTGWIEADAADSLIRVPGGPIAHW